MKVLITSSGKSLDSDFDLRFGRAAWFCVFNTESNKIEFIENENVHHNSGAGTKTAEKMIGLGVQKIITGDFGPKVKDILGKFSIQLVIIKDRDLTVGDIIDRIRG
jgi:predicted Fe-Mo cluster-binding NifX family protein